MAYEVISITNFYTRFTLHVLSTVFVVNLWLFRLLKIAPNKFSHVYLLNADGVALLLYGQSARSPWIVSSRQHVSRTEVCFSAVFLSFSHIRSNKLTSHISSWTKCQRIWQQRNVAPQLISLWLTAIFSMFDRIIANTQTLAAYTCMWFEFAEIRKVASISIE